MTQPTENQHGEKTPERESTSKTAAQILAGLVLRVSPEKYEAITQLDVEQIEALGEDVLASEKMTINKITVITYELTINDILLITPAILKTITEEELNGIIENGARMQYRRTDGILKEINTLSGPFSDAFHIN